MVAFDELQLLQTFSCPHQLEKRLQTPILLTLTIALVVGE